MRAKEPPDDGPVDLGGSEIPGGRDLGVQLDWLLSRGRREEAKTLRIRYLASHGRGSEAESLMPLGTEVSIGNARGSWDRRSQRGRLISDARYFVESLQGMRGDAPLSTRAAMLIGHLADGLRDELPASQDDRVAPAKRLVELWAERADVDPDEFTFELLAQADAEGLLRDGLRALGLSAAAAKDWLRRLPKSSAERAKRTVHVAEFVWECCLTPYTVARAVHLRKRLGRRPTRDEIRADLRAKYPEYGEPTDDEIADHAAAIPTAKRLVLTTLADLYRAYQAWCAAQKTKRIDILTPKSFAQEIATVAGVRRVHASKRGSRSLAFSGIGLRRQR